MNWYQWFHSFDFLLLDFPIYHLLILILVLVCMGFVWGIYWRVRDNHQTLTTVCPSCGAKQLITIQHCKKCKMIRRR